MLQLEFGQQQVVLGNRDTQTVILVALVLQVLEAVMVAQVTV
jgi:hypothetical protein